MRCNIKNNATSKDIITIHINTLEELLQFMKDNGEVRIKFSEYTNEDLDIGIYVNEGDW